MRKRRKEDLTIVARAWPRIRHLPSSFHKLNPRKMTVTAPRTVPTHPKFDGTYHLQVFATDSGFELRWVLQQESPIYINPKTGQKAYFILSLTNKITELQEHGKMVLD
jgi:hypothetical protein